MQQTAANLYLGRIPEYQKWTNRTWLSTYPLGGSYDPGLFWSNFSYALTKPTDSAAAATALFTGIKTTNGRIAVSGDGTVRLSSLGELARSFQMAVGAVTSGPITDATPGAFLSHNDSRTNYYAMLDEAFWGDPNTTGLITNTLYGGGHGPTFPPVDVLIGGGNPNWAGSTFVNAAIYHKLKNENGQPGKLTFVERLSGQPNGGARLIQATVPITVTRLAGLFGGAHGDFEYRLADGSGANPENPTLAEIAQAALNVLDRNPHGFVLMIESGSVDHASHANNLNQEVGEEIAYNEAVETVVNWVNDPSNRADWTNTLIIATADHETGYLTAGPGILPDSVHPIGPVNAATLAQEKMISGQPDRASWDDANNNNIIDPSEQVYWSWNSTGHSNSLVPYFANGYGAGMTRCLASNVDPQRGLYMDNTNVFEISAAALQHTAACVYHQANQKYVNSVDGQKYLLPSGDHVGPPWSSDSVTISFSVSYTSTEHNTMYYTNDGSQPSGSKGTGYGTTKALNCEQNGIFNQPAESIITCQPIPPQAINSPIHYIVESWNSAGGDLFANSISCSSSMCATVFSYTVQGPHAIFLSYLSAPPKVK